MCSRIYGVFTDIRCGHGYIVRSLIYSEGTNKTGVHVSTLCSGVYGVFTDKLCGVRHILWSRIYCVLTDTRRGLGYTVCSRTYGVSRIYVVVTDIWCGNG